MRKKFIAGNWKMYMNRASAVELARAVAKGVGTDDRVRVAVFPPFPYLLPVAEAIQGSPVALGAQNVYPEKEGAYTGEVSPQMLLDVGCHYAIVGHSERRQILGEKDDYLNRKVHAALAAGLEAIFCIGETLHERQDNRFEEVLRKQLTTGLVGLKKDQLGHLIVAYEPVWAIGTGHTATPQQAQDAHAFIRSLFAQVFGLDAAEALTIQYGGSVKADNAAALLSQSDVDGALVGGASLKSDQFLAIVKAGMA